VDEVVTTDGETVAVSCWDSDGEVGASKTETRCDCNGSAVDGVVSESVDVVWESTGASDTGYESEFFAWDTHFSHCFVELVKDSEVAAAGTPSNIYFWFVVLSIRTCG